LQPNPATSHQVLHVPPYVKSTTTFAVLDLETSGGSPRLGAGITEIGVVKVRAGEVLGTFQSFVDPGHSLPYFITELTGITDEMLVSAPYIDEILPTLYEFLGSADETVIVAHNSPFDLSFLRFHGRIIKQLIPPVWHGLFWTGMR
jgi:DNA polymerase III epsilon subunit-like protein